MKLNHFSITEAKEGLAAKKFSSVELTKACLEQIKATEPDINAFVTVSEAEALKQAEKADMLLADGQELPLLGIPMTIKDNFSTIGIKTTASSKVLDDYKPPFNATVIDRLTNAGMVMLGKTNMDAWAHGSSTETSDYGTTKNPWDLNTLPGGSSGGAAASMAADQGIAAIGSETAGSIRQPSSWCGVVGLKPTYGRVSRYGVVAMGSSLDCPGPITKSVEDSAQILQVIAGHDVHDATSSPKPVEDYLSELKMPLSGATIGIADDYFEAATDEVRQTVLDSLKIFEKLGAKIKKIQLLHPKYAIAIYTIIQRSEVASNLSRYDGIRYGNDRTFFGDEAKRRIMLGTYALSAGYYDQYYNKALKVRTLIIEDFKKAFQDIDFVIAPTSPTTALPVGASKDAAMFGEMADMLVEPSAMAGLAGINIPCGFSKDGMPIGLQIIGPQFSEASLLRLAYQYEHETDWRKQKPALAYST